MIGSLVRDDNSGLGILAWEFQRHGILDKVIIWPNNKRNRFPERFPRRRTQADKDRTEWFLEGLKILLVFETPFDPKIIPICRERGIRIFYMPMHECLNKAYLRTETHRPDMWLMPSSIEMEIGVRIKKFMRVPVNTDVLKWRQRKKAKIFIHNAGHGGVFNRNGTPQLIKAMDFVKSPIKLIIRTQVNKYKSNNPNIDIRYEQYENYWDLWNIGDVFVFPERFNGLSLPVQEAFASGLVVMTTNKEAFNFLPEKPLINPQSWRRRNIGGCLEFDDAIHDPKEIARKMDEIYDTDISEYSLAGKEWAEENSWKVWKDKYLKVFEHEL